MTNKYFFKRPFLFFISFLLLSCGTSFNSINPNLTESTKPELNTNYKIEVGESLIERELGLSYDAIILKEDVIPESYYVNKRFKSGEKLIKVGETVDYYLYKEVKFLNQSYNNFGVALKKGNKENMMFSNSDRNKYKLLKVKSEINFESEKYKISNDDYFKQEFIYNGKVGSGIKFIYREYINNTARPAFQQDLQYDLNESNIIGFKGLRIEIVNASNTNIEYKIISSFNK